MTRILTIFSSLLLALPLFAQSPAEAIRLNQIGFYPNAPKLAAVLSDAAQEFHIKKQGTQTLVFSGQLSAPRINPFSQKVTKMADFSAFRKNGTYVVEVPGIGISWPFEIQKSIHQDAAIGALRGFYYQRVSTALPQQYAGQWARPTGHPDNQVLIHASAASPDRPTGTVIASPMGWYDAGDYNKYIVNSGISMGTLLSLYEDFPDFCKSLKTNIPESKNAIPDLLDEILWNLRWMLTMQDPNDGGVYHKLTTAEFESMNVMPQQAKSQRYVVQKNTIATLDFAAVTAQASRIFKVFEKELPGLADSCRTAAEKAWQWALKNPAIHYNQKSLNKQFDPDINTGAYGDEKDGDEWIWAAAELYLSTQDEAYYKAINFDFEHALGVPSWSQVKALGYYSLIRHEKKLSPLVKKDLPEFKKQVLALADDLLKGLENQPYHTVMGKTARDFGWGSSGHAANQGIVLIQAFRISGDKKYLQQALGNLDYLLGRNATGYSFLTGFGDKPPMHPHHRPSNSDGIAAPVPGLLSGGPNPGQQDKCSTYPNRIADESFIDDVCSYASNEIAINWNAPFVYLAMAIEALQKKL